MNQIHDIPGVHRYYVPVPAHAAATATEEFTVLETPFACVVTAVKHIPDDAITGADTNTTHLNLINTGAAGTGTTEIANVDYVAGKNGVAQDANALTLSATAASLNLAADDVVALQYQKVGTGLAMPTGMLVIDVKAR